MSPIAALIALHLVTRAKSQGGKKGGKAPKWPTPSSPPPMPAFEPKATPGDASQTATPLAALHATPPTPPPARTDAARPKAASSRPRVPRIVPGVMTSTLPVERLQRALNARGAKLVPDGLYGPKTAAAWSSLAKSKGLPAVIKRKSPSLADVATNTFDALSLPAIP